MLRSRVHILFHQLGLKHGTFGTLLSTSLHAHLICSVHGLARELTILCRIQNYGIMEDPINVPRVILTADDFFGPQLSHMSTTSDVLKIKTRDFLST